MDEQEHAVAVLRDARLERTSTAQQVAGIVRDAIMGGTLLPGTPLREGPLSASLGVSHHTFREAMRLLSTEGLVNHALHRGVVVRQLSEQDIRDLFRVRWVLESAGIDAIRENPDGALEQLRPLADALEQAAQTGDWRQLIERDLAFHRQIVAYIGSPRLDATYASFQRELQLVLTIVDPRVSMTGHRQFIDLMEREQWDEVRAVMREGLNIAERVVIEVMREREVTGDR